MFLINLCQSTVDQVQEFSRQSWLWRELYLGGWFIFGSSIINLLVSWGLIDLFLILICWYLLWTTDIWFILRKTICMSKLIHFKSSKIKIIKNNTRLLPTSLLKNPNKRTINTKSQCIICYYALNFTKKNIYTTLICILTPTLYIYHSKK
jgi:hypothetical protein